MTRIIQQITQQLIDRLPDNEQYYRLDELRSWGFPSFIAKRIKIELERNLAESMIPPKTDWANIKSDTVQFAWQKFVDAIRAEARLPASYAKTVIETAVADVVEMLIQPRKNIPEVIFGNEEKLSYDQIADRAKAVVVYRHFATLVPRFMQKKELEKLSKERCAKIIEKADQKLTARYSPLNWAQMLEPLFNLLEGSVDTNLFRLFFEDKNMPRVAREFDLMNDTLTRAQFIEVLSSPELLDFEGYEDDQSTLFGDQPETSPKQKEPEPKVSKKADDTGAKIPEQSNSKEQREDKKESKFISKDEMSSLFPDSDGEKKDEEEESGKNLNTDYTGAEAEEQETETENKDNSLNAIFSDQEQEEPEDEGRNQSKEAVVDADERDSQSDNKDGNPFFENKSDEDESDIDNLPNSGFPVLGDLESYLDKQEDISEFNKEEDVPLNPDFTDKDDVETKSNQNETGETKIEDETESDQAESQSRVEEDAEKPESPLADQSGETPMWMRYMSEEEIEDYKKQELEQSEIEEAEDEEDEFVDDPIIDLTNEEASDEEIEELSNLLSDDRELFVEEIFRGSDRAFDEAVEEVATYDNWRNASKYIREDIFKRNLVDMYSEEAVDFTDRLQSYFLGKQKSK